MVYPFSPTYLHSHLNYISPAEHELSWETPYITGEAVWLETQACREEWKLEKSESNCIFSALTTFFPRMDRVHIHRLSSVRQERLQTDDNEKSLPLGFF